MKELFIRFVVGGTVVACFAVLGDLLKPKSLAGLLGAAPSVALATLSLTVLKDGKAYAQTEARSMIVGAIAFFDLRFVCESPARQAQAAGLCRYSFVDPHMDGCRLRALVRSLEISQ
jgi:hypothetical protein